jgi:hypothetical protein
VAVMVAATGASRSRARRQRGTRYSEPIRPLYAARPNFLFAENPLRNGQIP